MPTEQVAHECCSSQDACDDDCEQQHSENKDGKEHRASWVVTNGHEDEATNDGHNCKESEANASRREMQEKQRQQCSAFLLWRRAHRPNVKTERQPPGEAAACNPTSQTTIYARTGKRGGCSLQ